MRAVYKKELKGYFTNMTGYVITAGILLFAGIFTIANNFIYGYPKFEYAVSPMGLIYLLAGVFLTMGSFSSERRRKTDQLLFTSPASVSGIVMGKFFAMFTVFAIPTLIMCAYPLILSLYGTVSFVSAYSAIFTLLMLSAAVTAIGMFISSLTENIIISAAASLGTLLLIYFFESLASLIPATASASFIAFALAIILAALIVYAMTHSAAVSAIVLIVLEAALVILHVVDGTLLEGVFPALLQSLALFSRFSAVTEGMFDLTAVVLFATIAALFCFLTRESLEKRRWS